MGCGGAPRPALRFEAGPPPVRVGLALSVHEARVGAASPFTLADGHGVIYAGREGGMLSVGMDRHVLVIRDARGRILTASRGPYWIRPDDPARTVRLAEAEYPGHFVLRLSPGGGFNVVNVVAVETYLRSVVPAEIGHAGAYFEAAKAQAVAARTYLFRHLGQYPEEGYDLEAGVGDQVYASVDRRHPDSDRAVALTRGLILTHAGRPIRALYSSTCGGRLADARESFRFGKIPYLRAHKDDLNGRPACRTSRYFRWKVAWTGEELFSTFSRTIPAVTGKQFRGRYLREVKVVKRGKSGRAVTLRIKTDAASYEVSRLDIRRVLERPEGGLLRSTAFTLHADRSHGRVRRLRAEGRGWGHGVGMCQWGAMQLSTEGVDYRRILAHYYPGARLRKIY